MYLFSILAVMSTWPMFNHKRPLFGFPFELEMIFCVFLLYTVVLASPTAVKYLKELRFSPDDIEPEHINMTAYLDISFRVASLKEATGRADTSKLQQKIFWQHYERLWKCVLGESISIQLPAELFPKRTVASVEARPYALFHKTNPILDKDVVYGWLPTLKVVWKTIVDDHSHKKLFNQGVNSMGMLLGPFASDPLTWNRNGRACPKLIFRSALLRINLFSFLLQRKGKQIELGGPVHPVDGWFRNPLILKALIPAAEYQSITKAWISDYYIAIKEAPVQPLNLYESKQLKPAKLKVPHETIYYTLVPVRHKPLQIDAKYGRFVARPIAIIFTLPKKHKVFGCWPDLLMLPPRSVLKEELGLEHCKFLADTEIITYLYFD